MLVDILVGAFFVLLLVGGVSAIAAKLLRLRKTISALTVLKMHQRMQRALVVFGIMASASQICAAAVGAWQYRSLSQGLVNGLLVMPATFILVSCWLAVVFHAVVNFKLVADGGAADPRVKTEVSEIRHLLRSMRWFHAALLKVRGHNRAEFHELLG